MGSIPESGTSPRGGNGNPLQYSCLGNSMDRGTWRATVCGVTKKSDMTERLNTHTHREKKEITPKIQLKCRNGNNKNIRILNKKIKEKKRILKD